MNLFTTNIPSSFPVGLRILAVDHDTNVLCAIHHICKRLRYQVTTCCTISDAMGHLFQQHFDIILIETHIPDKDTNAFVQLMTSDFKIPVIMMSLDNQLHSVMNSISSGACCYWTKPLDENLFKNMWQHVVRKALHELEEAKVLKKPGRDDVDVSQKAFIQTDPRELYEAKGLKKKGRDDDDDDVVRKAFSPSDPHEFEEAKGLKKRGRDDVDVSKQPLAKKPRLSWTPDLHQKFMSAVNHLGINDAVPKKVLKIMDCPGLKVHHVASHLQKYRKYLKGGIKKSKMNEFEFQGHKNYETQYSMTAHDQCHDKSLAEQHWKEIDFDFHGQKNNETQYSLTVPDQCHNKSPAEQHCTEIDESDIFFGLTDLFPDLNDDIHNVMR